MDPELTRLRASHPWVVLAGIVNNGLVVLVQVSGGRLLALNPGRKFITGVQPRGVRGTFDMEDTIDAMAVEEAIVVSEVVEDDIEVIIDMSRAIILFIVMELEVSILVDSVIPMELFSSEPSPNPVPACRMYSGRQVTLPCPFAMRLSTQNGNAPVSMYRPYIVSDVS